MATLLLVDDQVRMYLKIIDAAKPTTTVIVFNRLTSSLDDIVDQIATLPSRAFTSIGLVQDGTDRMMDYRIVEGQEPCALQGDNLLASWSPVITFLQSLQSLTGMATFDFISCLLGANPGFSYAISQISAQLGIALQASADRTGNLAQGGNWIQESDNMNIQDVYFTEAIVGYTGLLYTNFNYKQSTEMITQTNTGLVSVAKPVLGMKTFAPATISVWGDATYGGGLTSGSFTTSGYNTSYTTYYTGAPTGSRYTAIASNQYAFAALGQSGEIYAWGQSMYGGSMTSGSGYNGPYIGAPTGTGYTAIASTYSAFAALGPNGTIKAWGWPSAGGSGAPTGTGYTAIAASNNAFAALGPNGTISMWNRLIVAPTAFSAGYYGAPTGTGYIGIAANSDAFAALKSDGKIYAFGYSNYGGTGALIAGTGYTAIASNNSSFAALTSTGAIYVFGDLATLTVADGFPPLPAGTGYKAIASNGSAFAALSSNGTIVAWGWPSKGGSGAPTGTGYKSIASNNVMFATVTSTNTIKSWGAQYTYTNAPTGAGYTAIASNMNAFAALKSDTTIYAWGTDSWGGSGAPTGSGYTSIASNLAAFAALKSDNMIYAWGASSYGGIGAPTGLGYTAIASTDRAFVAIKTIPDATIITPPTASSITYGQTLATSTLTGGVANVAGLFTFVNTSTIPPIGSSSQPVRFTPTDQTAFSITQSTVTITTIAVPNPYPTLIDTYVVGTGTSGNTLIHDSVTMDTSGNIYIVGETNILGLTLSGAQGGFTRTDIYTNSQTCLLKYNIVGLLLWARLIVDNNGTYDRNIAIDTSGSIYITSVTQLSGFTLSGVSGGFTTTSSGLETYIAKYNSGGAIQWGRLIGGTGLDQINGMSTDSTNNIYVTGYTTSSGLTITGTGGGFTKITTNNDAFVAKYNQDGAIQWGRLVNISGLATAYGITNDTTGNTYVVGSCSGLLSISGVSGGFSKVTTDADAFIAKYSSANVLQWGRLVGGTGAEYANALTSDTFGNVYMAGNVYSTGLTISGALGGFVTTTTGANTFVAKYDTVGALQWARLIGIIDSASAVTSFNMSTDTLGNLYVASYVSVDSFTLTGLYGGFTSTASATYEGFIAQYSSAGALTRASLLPGKGNSQGRSIVASAGRVIAVGYTNDSAPTTALANVATNVRYGLIQYYSYLPNPIITTQPTTGKLIYGQSLASCTLTGGVTTCSGAFSFFDTAIVPSMGTTSQWVIFTPAEQDLYNTIKTVAGVVITYATSAPTITSVTFGNALVIVQWTAPAINNGFTIVSYTVTSSPGGYTVTTGNMYAVVSGLANGTAYTFTCVATMSDSNISLVSDPSDPVTPYTLPDPPAILSATGSDSQIDVVWFAPPNTGGAPISEYMLTATAAAAAAATVYTLSSNTSSESITGLVNGQLYSITIQAINAAGYSAASSSKSATPSSVPDAPLITSANADCAQATVTWSVPSNTGGYPITGYTISSSPDSSTMVTGPTTFTATLNGLATGTSYTVFVAATTVIGTGAAAASSAIIPVNSPYIQYKLRRGTAAAWNTELPTLAEGEVAFEYDTNKLKVGDGASPWFSLPYSAMTGPAGPGHIAKPGANRLLVSDGSANNAVGNAGLTYSSGVLYASTIASQVGLISTIVAAQTSTVNIFTSTVNTNTITNTADLQIATSTLTVTGDVITTGTLYNAQLYNTVKYDHSQPAIWTSRATGQAWNHISMSASAQYQVATTDRATGNSYIYRSTDYGNTWAQVLTFNTTDTAQQNLSEIAMSASGQYSVATTYGYNASTSSYANGYIYRSTDYGVTWTPIQNIEAWRGIAVSASGQYMTAVSTYIYVSSDYGITWLQVNTAYGVLSYRNVTISATGQFQTVAAYGATLFTSSDYGQTWTARSVANTTWVRVRMSASGQYQTATPQNEYLWVSSDYGNSWAQVAFSDNWNGLAISASGQYQIATATAAATTPYVSSDYGQTWTAAAAAVVAQWRGFAMSASGEYVSGTISGTIWTSQRPTRFATGVNTSSIGIGVTPPFSTSCVLLLATDSAYKPGTTTWTIASDERIKLDVVPADLDICYSNIQALNLRHFAWDSNVYGPEVTRDRHVLGFIAQEVKPIFPKSVEIFPEFTVGGTTFTDFHTLNMDQIANANIGAVQRLMDKVEARQSTIDGFGARFAAQQSTFGSLFEIQVSTIEGANI